MSDQPEAIVIATRESATDLRSLSKLLESKGAEVTSQLDILGQILIRCDPDLIPELAQLPGVASIERSGEIRLSPPDGDC